MSTHSCLILSLKELAWTRPQDDCLLALLGGRYLMPWQMMVVFLRLMKSLWLQSRLYSNAGSQSVPASVNVPLSGPRFFSVHLLAPFWVIWAAIGQLLMENVKREPEKELVHHCILIRWQRKKGKQRNVHICDSILF